MNSGASIRAGRLALLACLLCAGGLALLLPPGAAAATGYMAGAARTNITPPLFDAAADAAAFPTCEAAAPTFDGPRVFALSEPYRDTDGNGRFSYQGVGQDAAPEPFCDANGNGRYDGIYYSGGVDQIATGVHDPIDARAVAISDGDGGTVVIVSIVAQGIFENYVDRMRTRAAELRPGITELIVSANHNESSPDTVGIYGGPEVGGVTGANSGIDDYYMDFLVEQVAQAAAEAYDARVSAQLAVSEFPLPDGIDVHLSKNFPTTDDSGAAAAIDPKIRVLTATDGDGKRIFTTMNLAAHNQEIGHSGTIGPELSSDWPGYFHDRLEQLAGGKAMFLVGDNGSEEDPITDPPVDEATDPQCSDGCFAQAEATGNAFAKAVADHLGDAEPLRPGAVAVRRDQFFVPLENNLFKLAAAAGLFATRQTYEQGVPAGRAGNELKTEVDLVSVGPDLQMLTNPGEAFPALMVGSPWGIEEVGCPERPNPPVPSWHASASHRFEVGLANDLIGYEIPAWAFSAIPGAFRYEGPPDNGGPATCVNDPNSNKDPAGHGHKLETEGVGPTASNMVAARLTALADEDPDPTAQIGPGRFLYADGTTSRRPQRDDDAGGLEDAVAIWLADPGSSTLTPTTGTIVALSGVARFGDRPVDAAGTFMDYDGQSQGTAPDITTRGFSVPSSGGGTVDARRYVDLYPALEVGKLGAAAGPDSGGDSAGNGNGGNGNGNGGGGGGAGGGNGGGTGGGGNANGANQPSAPARCAYTLSSADSTQAGTDDGETLLGTPGNDVINGNGGRDTVVGLAGADCLTGDDAFDTIRGKSGDDVATGGQGRDFMKGNGGDDFFTGGQGKDRIRLAGGKDEGRGQGGNDNISTGGGKDRINGGPGNDRLFGNAGNDQIRGGNGNDVLFGGGGNHNVLRGGPGRDRCIVVSRANNETRGCEKVLVGGARG